MSKKTYNLVIGVLGGLCAVASAVVAYMSIENSPLIIASIGIGQTAVSEICSLFVKEGN